MTVIEETASGRKIVYPDSDGQPMADNTKQFRWIVTIKGNLDIIFAGRLDVFVAGDLLWYPVEGDPAIRRAPDAMVAFGRPKGDRGSYLQWREGGIAPQVVFEIMSPGNTVHELAQKFEFYDLYGVEEYYLYDPDGNQLSGWLRRDGRLRLIERMDGWVSPRLGIRFAPGAEELVIYRPDGLPFLTVEEIEQQRALAEQQRALAEQRAEQAEQQRTLAEQRAEQAEQRAEQAEQRAARLAERLRALGIDPDA